MLPHTDGDDPHFRHFAQALQAKIAEYGPGDPQDRQKEQLEELISLETCFRDALLAGRYGEIAYTQFITYICEERKQILDARPYFRERKGTFTAQISPALKAKDALALAKFACNFEFISFVMAQRQWGPRSVLWRLYKKIIAIRQEIVVCNMPLAINRARVFFSRTQRSHLSYMELINIAAKGLINGIDKYSPGGEVVPRVFRSTAMGRMGGDFIERYSETMIHFYPADRRKLYRANKAVGRAESSDHDYEVVAKQVNSVPKKKKKNLEGVEIEGSDVDEDHQTTPLEIADIMAASSCVSADSSRPTDPESPEPIERFAAPDSVRPDVQAEENDLAVRMASAIARLSVWERKILRLKGVRT